MNSLENKKVVIIGGSSGIGLATAKAVVAAGGNVIIASRSESKLNKAKAEIGVGVEAYSLDVASEERVKSFFEKVGNFDALVITAVAAVMGPFLEIESDLARQAFEIKFWGEYYAAKHGAVKLNTGGSITFFSGVASQKPVANLSALAAANGAVEALARSLAVELKPIRVNVVSPGLVATPAYDGMPEAQRQDYFDSVAASLPVKRVAQPEDIAQAVLYLIQNKYTTGTVIDVNGGAFLV